MPPEPRSFPASPAPVTVTTASGLRVHAIQTGSLALKAAHRRFGGPPALRLPAIVLDGRWTEPLPMLVWVVEHPEGLLLIDAGEVPAASAPETYLAASPDLRWFVGRNFRVLVRPHEDVAAQMRGLGLDPADVRWLVQTHLHFDHVGGLRFFPQAEVLVGRREFEHPPRGAAPALWPAWYRPRPVEYRRDQVGPFGRHFRLTRAGDVWLTPTPGHTLGHQSVVLEGGEVRYVFAGDAAFSEEALLRDEMPGIVHDVGLTRETNRRLTRWLREEPSVFLPSHDPGATARLARRQTFW